MGVLHQIIYLSAARNIHVISLREEVSLSNAYLSFQTIRYFKACFPLGELFSREANFLELRHAQFDSHERHNFAGSFSLHEKVSLNSFYFFAVEKFASRENIRLVESRLKGVT